MPANVVALVMRSTEGEELNCIGRNFDPEYDQIKENRGGISYYASKALPMAESMGSWLSYTEELIFRDYQMGKLPILKKPDLTIIGNLNASLPGEAHASGWSSM